MLLEFRGKKQRKLHYLITYFIVIKLEFECYDGKRIIFIFHKWKLTIKIEIFLAMVMSSWNGAARKLYFTSR